MTYKQIESSRERRLWVTQVLFPVIIVAGYIFRSPEARCAAKNKFNEVKMKVKSKFKKD